MTDKTEKKRALIIDCNNNFYRAYIVDPSLSATGQPIGGIVGFIKILQKLCRITRPNRIIFCWDGPGGSQRRRSLVKEYKEGRKPLRVNNNVNILDENDKVKNQIWQLTRAIEYMNDLPVVQLMIDGLEADDMIAHIANHYSLKEYNKIIVSNDKDFLQLCSKDTILFRPVKEEYVNSKKVVEEFGIHPTNFALARAVCGDVSDNLNGVEGVGLKTLAKRVPDLIKEDSMSIEELIKHCINNDNGKIKAYKNISESRKLIERNYQMMQLYSPTISYQSAEKVNYALDNSECTFNSKDFKKRMIEDGFGTLIVEELFNCMKNIVLENCKDNK